MPALEQRPDMLNWREDGPAPLELDSLIVNFQSRREFYSVYYWRCAQALTVRARFWVNACGRERSSAPGCGAGRRQPYGGT
ncbi:MAG: hypothetical protein U0231_00710 [Nitrospiraceae bacterium]